MLGREWVTWRPTKVEVPCKCTWILRLEGIWNEASGKRVVLLSHGKKEDRTTVTRPNAHCGEYPGLPPGILDY